MAISFRMTGRASLAAVRTFLDEVAGFPHPLLKVE
jgi:hypothetical protein